MKTHIPPRSHDKCVWSAGQDQEHHTSGLFRQQEYSHSTQFYARLCSFAFRLISTLGPFLHSLSRLPKRSTILALAAKLAVKVVMIELVYPEVRANIFTCVDAETFT